MAKSHIVSHKLLARNLAANWVGVLVDVLIAFFLTPFIVAKLGLAVYGIWSLLNSLISYMGLIDMGVRGSVGRFLNHYMALKDNAKLNQVLSSAVIFLTCAGVVLFLISYFLGQNFSLLFQKTPASLESEIAIALPLMALAIWATFLGAVYRSVLASMDRFELVNAIMIVSQLVRAGAVVYVLLKGYSIVGLAAVSLIIAVANMGFFALVAARLLPDLALWRLRWSKERFLEIWRFGIVAFLTRSSSQLIYQGDQIVVMVMLGPTAVGVYSIASMLIQYAQRFVDQVGGTLYPSIMRAGSLRDVEGLRTLYFRKAKISFFIGILLYAGFTGFGGDFIHLWLGKEFDAAILVLVILSGGEIAGLLSSCGGSILFSLNKLRFNLLAALGEALLNLSLSVMLVAFTDWGLAAVAAGTLVSAILVRGLIHPFYTSHAIDLKYSKYVLTVILPAVLTFALTAVFFRGFETVLDVQSWFSLLLAASVAAVIYLLFAKRVFFPSFRIFSYLSGQAR